MHPSQDTTHPLTETTEILTPQPRPRGTSARPFDRTRAGARHLRPFPDDTAAASRPRTRRAHDGGRQGKPESPIIADQIQTGGTGDKIRVTPLGLDIIGQLTFEEWSGLAHRVGVALRCCAFVLGDCLLYGEDRFGPPPRASMGGPRTAVSAERYGAARAATGIDEAILANYVYVARNVPRHMRRECLSWEHHRAVAKLKDESEQGRWLKLAAKEEMTSRRLRASIIAGRVVSIEELCSPPEDPGIPNHIVPINRLAAWWRDITATDWLRRRTADQLEAMRRDFAPAVEIIGQIDREIRLRRGQ